MHGFCGRDPIHLPGIHSSLILCCVAGAVVWEGGHSPKMQASSQGYKGLQLRSNVHAYKCVKCNDNLPGPWWDVFHSAYKNLVVYFPNSDSPHATQVPERRDTQSTSNYLQPGDELQVYGIESMPDRGYRKREPPINAPEWCRDAVTMDIMDVPVVASNGFSYELEVLQEWYKSQKRSGLPFTDPKTNLELLPFVVGNHKLYQLIEEFVKNPSKFRFDE